MLLTPRILKLQIDNTGNLFKDVLTAASTLFLSLLGCPILATATLAFLLPLPFIYHLVALQWQLTGAAALIGLGANIYHYSTKT